MDENSIEFEFQTDRNNYIDLRQTYLSLVLKLVKHRGFDTYETTEVVKEHKDDTETTEDSDEDSDDESVEPVIPVTHVNNIMHSTFSNLEVYINNQQI